MFLCPRLRVTSPGLWTSLESGQTHIRSGFMTFLRDIRPRLTKTDRLPYSSKQTTTRSRMAHRSQGTRWTSAGEGGVCEKFLSFTFNLPPLPSPPPFPPTGIACDNMSDVVRSARCNKVYFHIKHRQDAIKSISMESFRQQTLRRPHVFQHTRDRWTRGKARRPFTSLPAKHKIQ